MPKQMSVMHQVMLRSGLGSWGWGFCSNTNLFLFAENPLCRCRGLCPLAFYCSFQKNGCIDVWRERTQSVLVHRHWNYVGERRELEASPVFTLLISYYLDLEILENHCSSLISFIHLSVSHSQTYSVNKTLTISTCPSLYFLFIFLLKKIWVCIFISNDSMLLCFCLNSILQCCCLELIFGSKLQGKS